MGTYKVAGRDGQIARSSAEVALPNNARLLDTLISISLDYQLLEDPAVLVLLVPRRLKRSSR